MNRSKPMKRVAIGMPVNPRYGHPTALARPARDPDEYASFKPRPTTLAVMATPASFTGHADPVPKDNRHESEAWRRAVAALPCVLCHREGETQAAHRNEGKGMGLKTDDALTAALCQTCHSAIDQGPDFSRDERRRRLDVAILLTVRALARAGKLRIAAEGN